MLCFLAPVAVAFGAGLRSPQRAGHLAWLGYGMAIAALLSMVVAQLASRAGWDAVADVLFIAIGLLFPVALVLYLIGGARSQAQGKRKRTAMHNASKEPEMTNS